MARQVYFPPGPTPNLDIPFFGDTQDNQECNSADSYAWDSLAVPWDMSNLSGGYSWQPFPSDIPLSPFSPEMETDLTFTVARESTSALHMPFDNYSTESFIYDTGCLTVRSPSPTGPIPDDMFGLSPLDSPPWSMMRCRTDSPSGSNRMHSITAAEISPSSSQAKLQIPRVQPSRSSSQDSTNRFQCPECDRGFRLQKDLVRHKQSIHLKTRLWLCRVSECKYSIHGFNRKDKYLQHEKTHERQDEIDRTDLIMNYDSLGDRDLNAQDTDANASSLYSSTYGLGSSSCVSDAELSHRAQGNLYRCPILDCKSTFVNRHDLVRHQRTVHMNRNTGQGYMCASVSCKRPEKIWPRLDSFKKHIGSHHKDEDTDNLIKNSFKWSIDNGTDLPMRIITPRTFPQIRSSALRKSDRGYHSISTT